MQNLILLLLLLPSVTFNIIEAEIFPWSILCYAYVIFYRKSIDLRFFILITYLIGMGLISIILYHKTELEILRSFFAILNAVSAFFIIRSGIFKDSSINSFLVRFYWSMVFLMITQLLLDLSFLDSYFRFVVPRGTLSSISSSGGRGFRLLDSEPSRAALNFSFLSIYLYSRTRKSFFIPILIIANILYFKAILGLAFLIIYLLLNIHSYVPLLGIFWFRNSLEFSSNNRLLLFFNNLNEIQLQEMFYLILNISGFRLVSLLASYNVIFTKPFGYGLGTWRWSSISALIELPNRWLDIDYFHSFGGLVSIRPSSFFAGVLLELGLVGLIMVLWCVNIRKLEFSIFNTVTIISLLLMGSIGNPVPWLLLGLSRKRG